MVVEGCFDYHSTAISSMWIKLGRYVSIEDFILTEQSQVNVHPFTVCGKPHQLKVLEDLALVEIGQMD